MTQQNRSTESLFERTVTLSLQQTWVLTPVLYGWGDTCSSSAKFQAKEREDAKGSDQPEAERSCEHQLLFVFVLDKPVLPLGFLLFSRPLCALVDGRLPCAVAEAEFDQSGDLPPVFGYKCCEFCFSSPKTLKHYRKLK